LERAAALIEMVLRNGKQLYGSYAPGFAYPYIISDSDVLIFFIYGDQ